MAFAPPLPRLGPPLQLPKLLASLPNLGELSVVKPSNCRNPSRVFLITRSKIRYTARKPAPQALADAAAKAGAKVAATQASSGATQWIEGGAMDDEAQIVARGKAWGLEIVDGELRMFPRICIPEARGERCDGPQGARAVEAVLTPGKLKTHSSPAKLPDTRIRHGLKTNWVAIAPSSLPPSTLQAVQNWEKLRSEAMKKREEYTQCVRDRAHATHREVKLKNREIRRKIEKHMEEIQKVKILY